jgi:hypothetical protein
MFKSWIFEHMLLKVILNRIYGIMVSVFASSVVDRVFDSRSGQTKDYTIGICCFSTKHAALRRKNKDWLARNQNNVSEWDDMSICGLLCQWAGLEQSGPHHHLIEFKLGFAMI